MRSLFSAKQLARHTSDGLGVKTRSIPHWGPKINSLDCTLSVVSSNAVLRKEVTSCSSMICSSGLKLHSALEILNLDADAGLFIALVKSSTVAVPD